jgi:GNAT superfamily N-acetyltransferase
MALTPGDASDGTLPGVRIRPATAADVPSLVPLFAQWDHAQPAEMIAGRIDVFAATPHAELLVAELDGAVAGLAGVCAEPHLARPALNARLMGLVVGDAFRRRGVGEALLRAAEVIARGWGCDRMEVTSSRRRAAAQAFYPALGYEEQSTTRERFIRPL